MTLVEDEDYWADVRRIVDGFPPLTPEQRDRLAMLLKPPPRPIVTQNQARRAV